MSGLDAGTHVRAAGRLARYRVEKVQAIEDKALSAVEG
jgi:hypothetical protein